VIDLSKPVGINRAWTGPVPCRIAKPDPASLTFGEFNFVRRLALARKKRCIGHFVFLRNAPGDG
jgi:hypothetical protein